MTLVPDPIQVEVFLEEDGSVLEERLVNPNQEIVFQSVLLRRTLADLYLLEEGHETAYSLD